MKHRFVPCSSINCTEKPRYTKQNKEEITELRGVAMMMMKMMMLMCAVSLIMLTTTMISFVDAAHKKPDLIKVGDSNMGWRPELNYTDWARKHHFYVGDWLYFGFERTLYNVLEVNKTDYEDCRSDNPITNISRGSGRDVFNLTSAKPFYFLSGGGYCYHGMKLAVTVEEYTGPIDAPAPSPSTNSSPSMKKNVISTLIGAIVVGWTLVWNV